MPEIGADDAVFQPPLGLGQFGLGLVDLGAGGLDPLDPWPFLHQLQRQAEPLHAAAHRLKLAQRHVVRLLRDHSLFQQVGRAAVVGFELDALGLGFGQFGRCLVNLLGAVAVLQLGEIFVGGIERSRGAIAVGAVFGVLKFGKHVPLLHAIGFGDPQLDHHAADLGADEDLVRGNDVSLRLQGEPAGGGRRRGRDGSRIGGGVLYGRCGGLRRGGSLLDGLPIEVAEHGRAAGQSEAEQPKEAASSRAARRGLRRQAK